MMALEPIFAVGTNVDVTKRTRCGTLNVQTLEINLIMTLDPAVRADIDVLALQECWVSCRTKRSIRKAAKSRGFHTYFGEPLDGTICVITFSRLLLKRLECTLRDQASCNRAQLFLLPRGHAPSEVIGNVYGHASNASLRDRLIDDVIHSAMGYMRPFILLWDWNTTSALGAPAFHIAQGRCYCPDNRFGF